MKSIIKLSLILILTIFGCESDKITGKDSNVDCAGIVDGNSIEDNCGVCDDDSANDCEKDCAEVWGGSNICGCTDSTAINYNFNATFDDGSCDTSITMTSFIMNLLPEKDMTKVTYASHQINYDVKPGRLMFFPSYIPHQYVVDMGYEPFRFIHWNCQAIPKGVLNVKS